MAERKFAVRLKAAALLEAVSTRPPDGDKVSNLKVAEAMALVLKGFSTPVILAVIVVAVEHVVAVQAFEIVIDSISVVSLL